MSELPPVLDTFCADKLKVLADPTRLTVLEALLSGPQHVGQMNERLGLEQSLLSHHLKVLRAAGLVESVRDGKRVRYQLAPEVASNGGSLDLGCCEIIFRQTPSG